MSLSDWKTRLLAANIFYVPLAAAHFANFSEDIVFIDEDLTGSTLQAEIREYPDKLGAELMSMTTELLLPVEDKTWDDLVSDGLIAAVPPGETGTTSLKVSTVRLTIDDVDMAALPPSAVVTGGGVTLYWDFRITTAGAEVLVLAAGDFKIAQGISQ